jgi:hypothetical protein
MQTGWIGTGNDEAAVAQEVLARALTELPGLADQRADAAARRARETRIGDAADDHAFRAWLGGGSTQDAILGREPADLGHRGRVRRARELLRAEGLDDLLAGEGAGRAILDANVGYIPARPEPGADPALGRARALDAWERGERLRAAADAEAVSRARVLRERLSTGAIARAQKARSRLTTEQAAQRAMEREQERRAAADAEIAAAAAPPRTWPESMSDFVAGG